MIALDNTSLFHPCCSGVRWTSTTREEEFLVAVAALAFGASDFSMSSMMLQTLPMASEVTSTETLNRIGLYSDVL